MSVWELLCDCLPAGDLRMEASTDRLSVVLFLQWCILSVAWVTLLAIRFIRACTHEAFSSFVPQRNSTMRAHMDLNNDSNSVNVVPPCSTFRGGGLWPESPLGTILLGMVNRENTNTTSRCLGSLLPT